jgi:Leucine-rich repeat (LRR) protein
MRIGENHLTELPSNVFQNLSNLNILFINDNLLETIESSLFENNPLLTRLELQGNRINAIAPTAFANQVEFVLNLSNNRCVNQRFNTTESLENISEGIGRCIENFEAETETETVGKVTS